MPKDKSETHKRIMEAAKHEFMEYGFNDASLRRIAANAGIQVSGLYKHFSNKKGMFSSLVDPVVDGFYRLYHEIEDAYFSEIETVDPGYEWENENETVRGINYIYDHLDGFKLLLLKSNGTEYENFAHEVACLEENVTKRFMEQLRQKGVHVKPVDPLELHLLSSVYVESVFQIVEHNLTKEKAMHYADTLQKFYTAAWKALFGI